jgi:hypothetical protein
MPFGSVGYEAEVTTKGERLISRCRLREINARAAQSTMVGLLERKPTQKPLREADADPSEARAKAEVAPARTFSSP